MSGAAPAPRAQRHLVDVWNPSYATGDIMDAHLQVLLREVRANGRQEDASYVWWGKVRSRNRRAGQEMAHVNEVRDIAAELDGDGGLDREVHLYLTDYRSLYVGHVVEVVFDDVRDDEPALVPEYYASQGLECDCWFRLADLRRLVDDDLLGVIRALAELRVTHYDDKPVSLYGGMRDLPLVVTRGDAQRFFDPRAREQYTGGRLWAEFDADRAGQGAMQRELRDNLIGEDAWDVLHPTARGFVASAEAEFRRRRGDATFNFAPVALDFAKALEVHCNHLLAQALHGAPEAARRANVEGRTRDVVREGPLTLGQLGHVLRDEQKVMQTVSLNLHDGMFFCTGVAGLLREIAPLRNDAAHGGFVERDTAVGLRNRLLGVGCEGELVRLGRVRPRSAG